MQLLIAACLFHHCSRWKHCLPFYNVKVMYCIYCFTNYNAALMAGMHVMHSCKKNKTKKNVLLHLCFQHYHNFIWNATKEWKLQSWVSCTFTARMLYPSLLIEIRNSNCSVKMGVCTLTTFK